MSFYVCVCRFVCRLLISISACVCRLVCCLLMSLSVCFCQAFSCLSLWVCLSSSDVFDCRICIVLSVCVCLSVTLFILSVVSSSPVYFCVAYLMLGLFSFYIYQSTCCNLVDPVCRFFVSLSISV